MKKLNFEKVGKQWHPKTITNLPKETLKVLKEELKKEFPDTTKLRWYSVPISVFSRKDLERMIIFSTEYLRKNPSYDGVIYVLRRLGMQGTELPLAQQDKE